MKVCIHRGAKQIGGSCVEVESQGSRLLLDIGLPLDSDGPESVEMPKASGLLKVDPSLLGIVVSHPHMDHYGLAGRVPPTTPFLMGEAAHRILDAAAVFIRGGIEFKNVIPLVDRKPIKLGPFLVTPYLMDHSAYDSYALLIEGDGRRLFYTGDLRGHGRKKSVFARLVAHPPPDVNTLLMEGTTVARVETDKGFPSESEIETQMAKIFRATTGMPMVWCSGQNIDRIVTVFRACKKARRQLIMDMYTAHVLKATGNKKLPRADWKEVKVFLPGSQKYMIKKGRKFDVAAQYKAYRIFLEDLKEAASRSVMLFRPSMLQDLINAQCLDGACLVYSLWEGYLKDPKNKPFIDQLAELNIPMVVCHTSGHASAKDLLRLRKAFSDAVVVPIHTEHPESFEKLFGNVAIREDGQWWDVNHRRLA